MISSDGHKFAPLFRTPRAYRYPRSVPDNFKEAGEKFRELVEIMARLRAPGGCPWDRKQTFDTIKNYLIEETYEVLDAIDARDWPALAEELGDLLLQPVFFAEMAREESLFSIADALDAINQKLIRRHPHVFGDAEAHTAEDVKLRWDEIKLQEKQKRGTPAPESILDGVPRALPALAEADKIGHKVAKVGFEWPDVSGVVAKLQEEAAELAEAQAHGNQDHIEHELGDLLFNVVNLARYLKVDPEQALRKTNARFRRRFQYIEQQTALSGGTLEQTSLDRMEELWQQAKNFEG
jgi:MazG family protein